MKNTCALQVVARSCRVTDAKISSRLLSVWFVLYFRGGRGAGFHCSVILLSNIRPFGLS